MLPSRPLVEIDAVHCNASVSALGLDASLQRFRAGAPAAASALAAGVSMRGSSRLRALRTRLEAGRALRVVALGGSSTAGHKLPRESSELYMWRLLEWLQGLAFPTSLGNHTAVNAGTPAQGPQVTEKCLSYIVERDDADLVLVEYAQNSVGTLDDFALERLLRHLLRMRSEPAVVLVNLPSRAQVQQGALMRSEEGQLEPLAEHYGLPVVSLHRILLGMAKGVEAASIAPYPPRGLEPMAATSRG